MNSIDKTQGIIVDITGERGVLRGMLHCPVEHSTFRKTAVIFLHGWSGCRLGPHRMFVHMARLLSRSGYYSIRFDFNGHGESDGNIANSTIDSMVDDVLCVINFMKEKKYSEQFTLVGICSGSKVAIATTTRCNTINNLVLWSPEPLGSMRTFATAFQHVLSRSHEYFRKLKDFSTWKKLLTGKVNFKLVHKAIVPSEQPDKKEKSQEDIWMEQFKNYRGRVLIVYGGRDMPTVSAVANYVTFCGKHGIPLETHKVDNSNHSFYSIEWEKEVLTVSIDWLHRFAE